MQLFSKIAFISLCISLLSVLASCSLFKYSDEAVDLITKVGPTTRKTSPKAADAVRRFIKTAGIKGKDKGRQYIQVTQANNTQLSQQTLVEVIYKTMLDEAAKTSQIILEKEMRKEARQIAISLLVEYGYSTDSINDDEQ